MSRRSSRASTFDHEDLREDCMGAYITVVGDLKTDIRSKTELLEALEWTGRNLSQKALRKYWTSDRRSIGFEDFVDICKKENPTSSEELMKAFRKIDLNGDGFITRDELHRIMTQKGEKMTKEEVQEIIDDVDENGDGKLCYEEYCNMVNKTIRECKQVSRKMLEKKERKKRPDLSDSRRGTGRKTSEVDDDTETNNGAGSSISLRKQSSSFGSKVSLKSTNSRSVEQSSTHTDRPMSGSRRSLLTIDDFPKPSPRNRKEGVYSNGAANKLGPLAVPKNLHEWTCNSSRGAFFIDEESIVCHQFNLHLTEETQVWITIQPTVTKSMIIGDGDPIDTALFIYNDKTDRLEVTEKRDGKGKYGIKCTLKPGKYKLVPFTTGCRLKPRRGEQTKEAPLVKKDRDGKLGITKAFRRALEDIFDMCDLDDNKLMSREEFSWFNMRTSGEKVSNEEWEVVEEHAEMKDGELTKAGFVRLNEMEAQDGDGDTDDLWVTLDSMGYNKELFIDEACPFKIDVYTEDCDDADLTVSTIAAVDKQLVIKSIIEKGDKSRVKGMKDLEMYVYSNPTRASVVLENTSNSKVKVEVDCNNCKNCVSNKDILTDKVMVLSRSQEIGHHLVPADESLDWIVRTTEIIHK